MTNLFHFSHARKLRKSLPAGRRVRSFPACRQAGAQPWEANLASASHLFIDNQLVM